jgi:hypothetical protein
MFAVLHVQIEEPAARPVTGREEFSPDHAYARIASGVSLRDAAVPCHPSLAKNRRERRGRVSDEGSHWKSNVQNSTDSLVVRV